MIGKLSEIVVRNLFDKADISIGNSPTNDIFVSDESFFKDVLLHGSLGFGESYFNRKWESDNIDEIVVKILNAGFYQKIAKAYDITRRAKSKFFNLQDEKASLTVIKEHYDLPAEFYEAFLDPFFQYTCGLFENTDDLNQAQVNKMDLICQKLELHEGDRVLDIGGGWGGLAKFMAREYGAIPTVVTLSIEQINHIKKTLDGEVDVWLCDYRKIPKLMTEQFDAISSVGLFEHIGHKNYHTFFDVVNKSLKQNSKFLLHTLYTPSFEPASDPYLHKYIFMNGELPPFEYVEKLFEKEFAKGTDKYEYFQELTPHYFPTLIAWDNNLKQSIEKGKIDVSDLEERKWHFYFRSCAGAIKAKHMKVGQFLYEKK